MTKEARAVAVGVVRAKANELLHEIKKAQKAGLKVSLGFNYEVGAEPGTDRHVDCAYMRTIQVQGTYTEKH